MNSDQTTPENLTEVQFTEIKMRLAAVDQPFSERIARMSDDAAEAKFGVRPNGTVSLGDGSHDVSNLLKEVVLLGQQLAFANETVTRMRKWEVGLRDQGHVDLADQIDSLLDAGIEPKALLKNKTKEDVEKNSTIAVSSSTESRSQQLRDLINELVKVITDNGGSIQRAKAATEVAQRTGLPLSEVPYIVNSAVADNRITADLRSGILKLIS